ncbi:hypothetical protein BH23PLA1_BH23PLA1_22030 [soil metagenome]
MDYQLVVVQGRSASQAIKLADGVTTVGREEGCQLKINSSQVSRKHCELFEKKGLLLVKDLGSSNGTFVNGKRIDGQRVLEIGNELGIGPIKFRVEKAGAVAQAKPAAGPGDTAVAQAAREAPEPADEDVFELDFDDAVAQIASGGDPSAATPTTPPPTIDMPTSEPKPAPKPAPAKPPAASKSPAPPEPEPEPEPELADEAVAEFLMDIELDDEDKR